MVTPTSPARPTAILVRPRSIVSAVPRCMTTVRPLSITMTGSNRMLAYFVALARESSTAPMISSQEESCRSCAATTHQAAAAMRQRDIASKVAKAPRNWVGPRAANSAAAVNAAHWPNSRLVVPHSRQVVTSMNASDSILAPASPPKCATMAASGG